MDVSNNKTNLLKESGQSVFEFLVYLPILLVFFGLFVTISGSINGAINQSKAVRSYFFHLAKGNPNYPRHKDLKFNVDQGARLISMASIGWREKEIGDQSSKIPCYKIKPFLGSEIEESCDKHSKPGSTYLVKVGTMYGYCGPTYQALSGDYVFVQRQDLLPSCHISD